MEKPNERRPSTKIQWHPAFCAEAELELRFKKDDLEFKREYNLSKKPLQMDLLIIEKRKGTESRMPLDFCAGSPFIWFFHKTPPFKNHSPNFGILSKVYLTLM